AGIRIDRTNRTVGPEEAHVGAARAEAVNRKALAKAPQQVAVPTQFEVVEEEVLYGGGLMPQQYGHFLMDSMSSLWALDSHCGPVVFSGPVPRPGEYADRMLRALGISDRLRIPQRPTLFRKVICPSPA